VKNGLFGSSVESASVQHFIHHRRLGCSSSLAIFVRTFAPDEVGRGESIARFGNTQMESTEQKDRFSEF
jgi:hypothetical protein